MKAADPNSRRTKKRQARGFKGIESTRKYKRMLRRQAEKRWFDGKDHEPGVRADCSSQGGRLKVWVYTAGGSRKFY